MTISSPLEEAAWVYAHIGEYDRQQRFDATASLCEWGVFSLRHVGQIVGLSHTQVRRISGGKRDRTGGTFSPECLTLLLDIQRRYRRGEDVGGAEVAAMLAAGSGTSAYFAARLAGIKEAWVRSKLRKGSDDEQGDANSVADPSVADEPGSGGTSPAG